VAFWYAPEYFERLAADTGVRGRLNFKVRMLAPSRPLARLVARTNIGVTASVDVAWEELAVGVAVARSSEILKRHTRSAASPAKPVSARTTSFAPSTTPPG
jgi:hypothetical protein